MSAKFGKRLFTFPRLIVLALVILIAIMAMWALLRKTLVDRLITNIEALEAQGYQVGHNSLTVSGFPFWLKADAQDVFVRAPVSAENFSGHNWSVTADQVETRALVFYPVVWSFSHDGNMRIDMRGPDGRRYVFDVLQAGVNGKIKAGLNGRMKALEFATQKTRFKEEQRAGNTVPISSVGEMSGTIDAKANLANLGWHVSDVTFNSSHPGLAADVLGQRISEISGVAQIENWDLFELEGADAWMNRGGRMTSKHWSLIWGPADITGSFDLTFKNGIPEGVLQIRIKNAGGLFEKIMDAGLVPGVLVMQIKLFIAALDQDGDGRTLIEINFKDGVARYRFFPLYTF